MYSFYFKVVLKSKYNIEVENVRFIKVVRFN